MLWEAAKKVPSLVRDRATRKKALVEEIFCSFPYKYLKCFNTAIILLYAHFWFQCTFYFEIHPFASPVKAPYPIKLKFIKGSLLLPLVYYYLLPHYGCINFFNCTQALQDEVGNAWNPGRSAWNKVGVIYFSTVCPGSSDLPEKYI